MKKRILLMVVLAIFACLALTLSVSAKCEECNYSYRVETGEKGYFGTASAIGTCSVCGDTVTEKIAPLFTALGYSSSDNGVTQGYAIDREAISRYEELTRQSLTFGAVVAARATIGDANPLDEAGEPVSSKVKTYDLTDSQFDIIDVAVKSIPTDKQESEELLFAIYVKSEKGISYLDNCVEKTSCGSRSHKQVVDVPAKESHAQKDAMYIDGVRYEQIDIDFTQGKYYNNSSMQSSTDASFNNKFWTTTSSYTKETLPVGSIIVFDNSSLFQYRPHKWSGTRPKNITDSFVVVDEAWWGSFANVGFNISQCNKEANWPTEDTNNLLNISTLTEAQVAEIFKIYVKKEQSSVVIPPVLLETPVEPEVPTEKQNWADDGVLKILTIGNSFSDDSMEYVYQAAQAAGIDKVELGNLYIAGCTLATHLSNAQNNSASYTYRTNTSGSWSSTGGYTIKAAVESDDWDFISFQQASGSSGLADTYNDLVALIDIVEPLSQGARLVWHMTWAYQGDSGHSAFNNYNKDQMTMYNAIVSAVQNKVITDGRIEIVIPAGTAIQNARTSYIGDTLTRDGYHLSYDLGRYIGSLTFVKALTGKSIDSVTYMPSGVDENELKVAIESVNNAVAAPYSVTNSTYTSDPSKEEIELPQAPEVPDGYRQLSADELGLVANAFYNTSSNDQYSVDASNAFNQGFVTTKKLSKDDLPNGTIIEIASGWQYRPEGWEIIAGTRPDNVTTERIVIDDAWWGTYTQRAFNISKTTHSWGSNDPITISLDEIATSVLKIYVPISTDNGDDGTEEEKTYRELTLEDLELKKYAFYQSDASEDAKNAPILVQRSSSDSVGKKYYTTRVFTKEDIPVGSIIYIDSDWNYRPEGWVYSTSRPDPVNTQYVYVDEAWWGNYTQRAFNIARDSGDVIDVDKDVIAQVFKIYIPVVNETNE